MGFQWVVDNAESISINTKKIVASTQARDGTVRSVSRGGQVWTFNVSLPQGPRWSDIRDDIAKIQALDRVTTDTFSINNPGQSWLIQYQGDAANPAAFIATVPSSGNTITLTSGTAASGYNFRAGDVIQLGSAGHCYTVSAVAWNNTVVTLNRPIIDPAGSVTLAVAEDCVWTVICTQFPQWTIFARDQVSWDGPFVFVEDLT